MNVQCSDSIDLQRSKQVQTKSSAAKFDLAPLLENPSNHDCPIDHFTCSKCTASISLIYKMLHDFLVFWDFFDINAQRVACSNTSRTPSLVFAEHSRYLSARMTFFTASPSVSDTGFCDVFASSWITFWSWRKSCLHPTRMMGSPQQKCWTSDIHFSCTFSKESGESIAKQIKITWESGYESGRRRS